MAEVWCLTRHYLVLLVLSPWPSHRRRRGSPPRAVPLTVVAAGSKLQRTALTVRPGRVCGAPRRAEGGGRDGAAR